MGKMSIPVDLIWCKQNLIQTLLEAERWNESFAWVRSLTVISGAWHVPHDEAPIATNQASLKTLMQPFPEQKTS